jgi:hypothetical protein
VKPTDQKIRECSIDIKNYLGISNHDADLITGIVYRHFSDTSEILNVANQLADCSDCNCDGCVEARMWIDKMKWKGIKT